MGHHRSCDRDLRSPDWVDALLVVGAVVLVALRTPLAAHPIGFGVASALLVGMVFHRFFAGDARPVRARAMTEVRDEPRHSARAA